MLKGSCPDCGSPIEIDKSATAFACRACGARFEFAEKNGRRVVRRVRSASPVSPSTSPPDPQKSGLFKRKKREKHTKHESFSTSQPRAQSSNPFSQEKRSSSTPDYGWSSSSDLPYTVPPKSAQSLSVSAAPARQLEILLRMDRFWLLLLLLAAIPIIYPAYQLSYGFQDITLPGIGTLESRPKIEQADQTTTTTAYVTEARIMETRRSRGGTTTDYEVRYQFQVNGVWYTHADDAGRTNLWKPIDKDVWDRVARELETVGQSTIQVKYVTTNPGDNRPLDSDTTRRMQWVFLLIGAMIVGLAGLGQLYSVIREHGAARELAASGVTGRLKFWEVVPKKS